MLLRLARHREARRVLCWCVPSTATRGQPPSAGWTRPGSLPRAPVWGTDRMWEGSSEDLEGLVQEGRCGLGRNTRDGEGLPTSGLLGGNCSWKMPGLNPHGSLLGMHVPWPPQKDEEGLGICMLDTTPRARSPANAP